MSATLDQLIQDPRYTQTQGFIGRRIGPGVNANDSYVSEPTRVRRDYQLEPGVVQVDPDNTGEVVDAITYPGINDALLLQGAKINNANRLYTSDYYAWDPLVDLDKFVNYAQYYWLPGGPLSVDVSSSQVPLSDNFVVTRANGVYEFSGFAGQNPEISLVRGGSYTFQVAQNTKETENFRVTNANTDNWNIDYTPNPTLTLTRGNTYVFNLELSFPYAFFIKSAESFGTTDIYSSGVSNNGATGGLITFVVPQDAPDMLFYCNDTEFNLRGQINIIDAVSGTGPGFFIQADPGVNGVMIATPNISSRDVLGVINNGEDLGTVTFNVPLATAQNFFYNMPSIGTVDLISDLQFDQINGLSVETFLTLFPTGIDGITNLNGRTLIFTETATDPAVGGWLINSPFDPLIRNDDNNGLSGSFDSLPYDITTPITDVDVQRSIWLVTYGGSPSGGQYITLSSVEQVADLNKFSIAFGTEYSSTQWYKNDTGFWEQIPLLTAGLNRLYYQDATDPEIFGRFNIIDDVQAGTLDIEAIIGATDYVSPNGVIFSNGMKVVFRGDVYPASFANTEYYVEGVGTGPGIEARVGFIDGTAYFGPYHVHLGKKMVGAAHVSTFHQFIYDTVEQSLANAGAGGPAGSPLPNQAQPLTGLGTGIVLLPAQLFVTPETYTENLTIPYDTTAYDVGNYDGSLNQPLVPDYLTINRASADLNAWTRSNRWCHIDVITASAAYNNTVAVTDQLFRGRRPILEFRAGTRLFAFGTTALAPVDIIDLTETDALSNVNGSLGYSVDGYTLINGSTIIFAKDNDAQVRKTVYRVEIVVTNTNTEDSTIIDVPVVVLVPLATAVIDNTVVILSGVAVQGFSYNYDGVDWLSTQQKISVNQPPQFNLYDANGVSFGDQIRYPSSNFTGSSLFSYATGNANPDLVLGFPLTYLSLTNIGDIVFDNNWYKDSFGYTIDNSGQTQLLSTGFARQYSQRTAFVSELGWQTAATASLIRQQFQFTADGLPLLLDVAVNDNTSVPAVQIYANGQFVTASNYQYTVADATTTINLLTALEPGTLIEVSVLSDQISVQGFYEVPINLSNNPLNGNSTQFTLGTIRNHYAGLAENLIGLSGPAIGANNTRDLGNIVPYGLQILQQSSPLTLAGYFMRDPDYDIFASLAYNSAEYIKLKSQLLNAVTTFGIEQYGNWTVAELLDASLKKITAGRTNLNPFYSSDMLPSGTTFVRNAYTVNPITINTFNTQQTYDFSQSNYLGLCVYVNNVLLIRDVGYVVNTQAPELTITGTLAVGDVVTIDEYSNTAGNFVPNTPTKLGLYPKYQPRLYLDTSYVNPTLVIQGHDGSITTAFGDIRDQVLLQFETRVYSNLKNDGNPPPLVVEDVLPGYFRATDYSQADVNQILGEDFLGWVGGNKLDYTTQSYTATNAFTYNYSQAGNRLDGEPLLGAWRGIYRYFYDTMSPDLTPWEMLGLSTQPEWWTDRYGPTPYTSDNLVLWGDLEAGLVADPVAPYVIPKYRRPGLTSVIPVDSQGALLSPFYSVMGAYNPQGFVKSYQVGDGGPVEASWWMSSSYPFAVMRLLILTRPAEFFSLFADRDLYRYNSNFDQYLLNGRYRLQSQNVQVYGNGVSKASYLNWIVDYKQQSGINSTDALTRDLANLDVRLCYRMASFVAAENLSMRLEKSAPQSENSSLLIPPESYNLLLYKNQPFNRISYSAVIVEVIEDGYTVYGYNTADPYFSTVASRVVGAQQTLTVANVSVTVPAQYSTNIIQVPYGNTFINLAGVVDFLLSYGQYLTSQGLTFAAQENGYTLDWLQMAQEFLYFANQGWATGTIINLNPSATQVISLRPGAVVDSIISYTPENLILDQNRRAFDVKNLVVRRLGNTFAVIPEPGGSQTISYLNLKFTDYENMVVFDNRTIFNDLIYNSITGERQSRLGLNAATSTEWNGTLNAQGFILNQPNVRAWQSNVKYAKGEIVLYKNNYWQAAITISPKIKFEYSDWLKSNYDRVSQGLLQNLANKADQLANSYNTQTANLNSDNDLLSFGLIGFRPRQYMVDLNLSDTSQVNLYQQFVKTKGTTQATDLFTKVNFNALTAQYQIYENWGILAGTYGANANRSWFEVILDEALLTGNPSTVQIIQPGIDSQANQAVQLNNLWAESYRIPNTDILPTTYITDSDTALPSAGYVNIDDVDITVFSLNNPDNLASNIDRIGNGTKIWVAKDNSYDWNIYQCAQIPGRLIQLTDNLNGTSRAQFSGTVELARGDTIIIRLFNTAVDGVYRVLSTPTVNTVVIQYAFVNANQTSISGTGLAFYLQTMRVFQASDIVNLPYANQLTPGSEAWVDNDGQGHWQVLEKTNPFVTIDTISATVPQADSLFGTSLAQSSNRYALLVGAPDTDNGAGAVYTYRLGDVNNYVENSQLSLLATGTQGFGNSVDFGDRTWAVAAASASNNGAGYVIMLYLAPGAGNYVQTQLLVDPQQQFGAVGFGTTVKMSSNERWLYASTPVTNRVHAYCRVDVPRQSVSYIATGTTAVFSYADSIMIDAIYPDQLIVIIDNLLAVLGIDYAINASLVQFFTTPTSGQHIIIRRRTAIQLDAETYYNVVPDSTSGTGTGALFTVNVVRGIYSVGLIVPGTGYIASEQLTILGTAVGGATPANDITVTVDEVTVGGITEFVFSGTGINNTAAFDLGVYLYTATDLDSFTVTVNGVLQRPHLDYDFATGDSALPAMLFNTLPPPGAVIVVDSASAGAYWQYVSSLNVSGLPAFGEFGISIGTDSLGRQILIGAPNDSATDATGNMINNAGSVYAFDRGVVKYLISDVTQLTYVIPGQHIDPVTVILNNQNLTNTAYYINGDFTVSGSSIILSANLDLNVGDSLEIETNLFQLLQKVTANTVIDQSRFGQSVAICPNSCSVYSGAPLDSFATDVPQAGLVQREVNQSRIYGITSSTVSNPTLTAGDTIRINNMEVIVPNAPNNTVSGLVSAINASVVPNVIATRSADVILTGDGVTKIFAIGNVYAGASAYNTVVLVNLVLQTVGVDYSYNNTTRNLIFVTAPATSASIVVQSGRMTVSVIDNAAASLYNKLTVLPGLAVDDSTLTAAFYDLGFDTYVYTQTIVSPNPTDLAQFGASISVNTGAENLVIGSPNGNIYEPLTFDLDQTLFDDRSTTFFSSVANSGVVFTYDYLPSAADSVTDPGKFVFGQQVYSTALQTGDQFGSAVSYRNGRMLSGAPGNDLGDSSVNYGAVYVLDNANESDVWQIRHTQLPRVDVNLLNSVYSYDKFLTSTQTYFDFIDPLQGKILGVAQRNINYIGAVDPASYNVGSVHNIGTSWGAAHVGEIWWDTDRVRFIDANQDGLAYASRRWGQVFPGSTVDCYQWTASTVPPVLYVGPGVAFSTVSYTVASSVDNQGLLITAYFFWVQGINTVATQAGKTLSPAAVASYILNPAASGLPYMAALTANAVALYNASSLLSANNTVLHVEYDRQALGGSSDIHQEYEFIAQGRADAFLNANLYRKLLDSFCGATVTGAAVPDPLLSPGMQYGVQFRPRQGMFVNRLSALQNYLGRANAVLSQYPVSETRRFNLLNSAEPVPSSISGAWDFEVPNLEVLAFQNLNQVPVGYKYLVQNDSQQAGRWTIYEVATNATATQRVLNLQQVQTYDTTLYWNYIDWYLPGYNSSVQPVATVANVAGLQALDLFTVPIGASVKVTANGQGKFEIYRRGVLGYDRVALQDGTISFSDTLWNYALGGFGFDTTVFDNTYFDQEPVTETRNIIRSINEELFVEDLLIERNQILMLTFQYIYSEFSSPNWLFKTSYITVDHVIRGLLPFELYQPDNQTFVLDYLAEVKPYHVQNLSFNLIYDGIDAYAGNLTDYDVPAYWKTDLSAFVSPVLAPYALSNSVNQSQASDVASDGQIWLERPWSDWFNNHGLGVDAIAITDNTVIYSGPPIISIGLEWSDNTSYVAGQQIFYGNNLYTVIVSGISGTVAPRFTLGSLTNGTTTLTYSGQRAQATASLRANGTISIITVTVTGSGYLTTPDVAATDPNNGTVTFDHVLVPIMGNNLVRSIKTTMRYDRYEYHSEIVTWSYLEPSYVQGQRVRYQGRVYQANSAIVNTPVVTTATASVGSFNITVSSTAGLVQGMLITAVQLPSNTVISDIDGNTVLLSRATVNSLLASTIQAYLNFDLEQWTAIDADLLSGVDRTMGFYTPTVDMPGLSLPLLIDGVDYPGVQVDGPDFNQNTGFDIGNYDINPFDNISFDANGSPTYDPGILDARYSSAYLDQYLGTRAIDINVDGGVYIGPFSSHAPEELVPGAEFDTLDMRVFTRPGSDWLEDGHGFPSNSVRHVLLHTDPVLSFAGLEPYIGLVLVSNVTQGIDLYLDIDYSVDYVTQHVEIFDTGHGLDGDIIVITAYEPGGGNQLYKNVYNGQAVGNTVTVPVAYYQIDGVTPQIQEFLILINGAVVTDFSYVANGNSNTTVTFDNTYTVTDHIALYVLGATIVDIALPPVAYSWSLPETQIIVSDGTGLSFNLDNALTGCNPDCLIVTVNGVRARTAAGVRYTADGSTGYDLPDRLGVNQSLISDNQVRVYVNDVAQILYVDFVVEPSGGYNPVREILFEQQPPAGSEILIYVSINVQCLVNNTQLVFVAGSGLEPGLGDVIAVTTWNDTRQQRVLSQCFVGPVVAGVTVNEPYDSVDFDVGNESGAPGSYDYTDGVTVISNSLNLDTIITDPDRLWVSLNGNRLFNNQQFTVIGTELFLASGALAVDDVVMITQFTNSVVPETMAFRIYQDMRGVQATYRITDSTTTVTVATVAITSDVIMVANASALPEPNFANNQWGVITIDAERVMYRTRDTTTNTVSGLLRGTGGTAVAGHDTGSIVYNLGHENLLIQEYQDYIVSNTFLGDDTTVDFTAPLIDLTQDDSTLRVDTLEIYVGGIKQNQHFIGDGVTKIFALNNIVALPDSIVTIDSALQNITTDYTIAGNTLTFITAPSLQSVLVVARYSIVAISPVQIVFETAPASGFAVTLLVRRGVTWYTPGISTASNGAPLQITQTPAARFLRGL